jgi:VWFA-related protein
LVEVEVVVRDAPVRSPGLHEWLRWTFDSGPPFGPPGDPLKGLTRDDFTLLDEGKPQRIAVFGAGASSDAKPVALPPGAVSNRMDRRGQPVNGATAVLIDFLNLGFLGRGMMQLALTDFLRSLNQTDNRIALYTLGENLHLLQDFTDDPQKLIETAATLDKKHGPLRAALSGALRDNGDLLDLGAAEVHGRITVKALAQIIQHLSGMPGRKSLVWTGIGNSLPREVIAMVQRANIVLYPVGGRGAGDFESAFSTLSDQHALQDVAAATGGRQFYDARDLIYALRTAEEDTSTPYVLGYYPAENMLDGKYHTITVKLYKKVSNKQDLEIHYRPGYLATKTALPMPAPTPEELFKGSVNSARIGLVALATPEAQHPGLYDVLVTVDVHDIRLERKDDHFIGSFDVSVPIPSSQGNIKTGTVPVDLTEERLAKALENGLKIAVRGVEAESGGIRVVVRDRASGTAGSLRIPVAKQ